MQHPSLPPVTPARASSAETGKRLLDLLLLFSASAPRWTIQELSDQSGFSLSTTYRYVAALRETGLLERMGDAQYRVTDLVFALAEAAKAARAPLAELARPILSRLRDEIGESVFVARRTGKRVVMVAREESRRPVRLQFEPGRPMSLHTGSLSRVLLAAMPLAEKTAYLLSLNPEVRNRTTLSDESLALVAAAGRAESFEEVDEGIWGTSAVVKTDGAVTAALGCAAPLYRNDEGKRMHISTLVSEAAEELTALLSSR
jgi:DNA-binding IclR family transcriptional regulator